MGSVCDTWREDRTSRELIKCRSESKSPSLLSAGETGAPSQTSGRTGTPSQTSGRSGYLVRVQAAVIQWVAHHRVCEKSHPNSYKNQDVFRYG